MVGGAVGDALGFAVEFASLNAIKRKYGERGIIGYEVDVNGVAEFSDDTQMSLFTAAGLLTVVVDGKLSELQIHSHVRAGYEDWYATQKRSPYPIERSWLSHLASLWSQRAPGMTRTPALHQISYGDGSPVDNNSKGCGGVMRVAPTGILAAAHLDVLDFEKAGNLAGIAADITHKPL